MMIESKNLKEVRVCCHCCDGSGTIEDVSYPDHKTIKVLCPECEGVGFVHDMQVLPHNKVTVSIKKKD